MKKKLEKEAQMPEVVLTVAVKTTSTWMTENLHKHMVLCNVFFSHMLKDMNSCSSKINKCMHFIRATFQFCFLSQSTCDASANT